MADLCDSESLPVNESDEFSKVWVETLHRVSDRELLGRVRAVAGNEVSESMCESRLADVRSGAVPEQVPGDSEQPHTGLLVIDGEVWVAPPGGGHELREEIGAGLSDAAFEVVQQFRANFDHEVGEAGLRAAAPAHCVIPVQRSWL